MQYIIFDGEITSNFTPLTLTRPAFDLTLGTKTLLQNLTERLNLKEYTLKVQPHLTEITRQRHKRNVNPSQAEEEAVFINGLITLGERVEKLLRQKENFTAFSGDQLALAKLSRKDADEFLQGTASPQSLKANLKRLELPESTLIRYPWELVERTAAAIEGQVKNLPRGEEPVLRRCEVLGRRSNLLFEGSASVEPYVTFDLRRGSVWIGEDAEIQSSTRIEGPAYIGRRAQIRSARVHGGTTIGDYCKVGGEVDCSIVSGYSNKAHDGFLGHSYVGEWVNIGAGTSNSDLKNTYGTVKMELGGMKVDTGSIKIGCFIADYAKTSIGCFIYTGKKIGVSSQIHGYISEDVPSFTIYANSLVGKSFELRLDSAVETQKRMMERRGVEQTEQDKALLAKVFEITQDERYGRGVLKAGLTL
ncbi:MAG: putative sugar nucleotidyl transferase [Nitrososphaerales archaeon]